MLINTQIITVDLSGGAQVNTVRAVQEDTGSRKVAVKILNNGAPAALTGLTGVVRYKRSDGTGGAYDTLPDGSTPAVSISGNVATAWIVPQALSTKTKMQIGLISGQDEIHTFSFDILAEPNAWPGVPATPRTYGNIIQLVRDALRDLGQTGELTSAPPMVVCTDAAASAVKNCPIDIPLTDGAPVAGQMVLVVFDQSNSADEIGLKFANFDTKPIVYDTANTDMGTWISYGPHLFAWRTDALESVINGGEWELLTPRVQA